jgi:hypothetical protein
MPVSGQEFQIDAVLEDSFPASDPPSWTTGTAETGRAAATPSGEEPADAGPKGSALHQAGRALRHPLSQDIEAS